MKALDDLFDTMLHAQVPQLADTIPPVQPPCVLPLCQPQRHDVVAWRNDGGRLEWTRHDNLDLARAYAQGLHYATYYKYAITCGRDTVERGYIEEPWTSVRDLDDADYAAWCEAESRREDAREGFES